MADVYFSCECGKSLAAAEWAVGRKGWCVDCGRAVEVPAFDVQFRCRGCGAELLAAEGLVGSKIKCTECGWYEVVPAVGHGLWNRVVWWVVAAVVVAVGWLWMDKAEEGGKSVAEAGSEVDVAEPRMSVWSERQAVEQADTAEAAVGVWPKDEEGYDEILDDLPPVEVGAVVEAIDVAGASVQGGKGDARATGKNVKAGGDGAWQSAAVCLLEKQKELCAFWDKGNPSGSEESIRRIRAFWQYVLEYTRSHEGADLDEELWARNLERAYEFMLYNACRRRREAESMTREVIGVLQKCRPQKAWLAAEWAGRFAAWYASAWMRHDVVGSMRLVDETVDWVWGQGEARAKNQIFWSGLWFLDGNCLLNQYQLPQDKRAEFCAERERRLMRYLSDKDLSLKYRTYAVSQWAMCLMHVGRFEDAHKYLMYWWQRHSRDINEAPYFEALLTDALDGRGDWELARKAMNRASELGPKWSSSYHQKLYEWIGEEYYDSLRFAEYELRRCGRRRYQMAEQRLALPLRWETEEPVY